MKSTHNWYKMIAAFMVAATTFLSCQKAEPEFVPGSAASRPDVGDVTDSKGLLTFVADSISLSKTHWNVQSILWSKGDMISIGYNLNNKWSSKMYASDALSSSAHKALFKVKTDLAGTEKGSLRFYGVYPSSAVTSGFASAPVVTVKVPSKQSVSGTTFDGKADIMIASSYEEYESVPQSSIPLTWNRVVAHADIKLSGLGLKSGETVCSLVLTTDENICGEWEIDLVSGKCTAKNAENELIVSASSLAADASGNVNVWAALMPCTLKSFKVEVATTKRSLFKEVSSCDITFTANARNQIGIDMSSATVYDNSSVNTEVFKLLNLNYPGLDDVRSAYERGHYRIAADALVEYFRARTSVVNPEINLNLTTMTAEEKSIADQALEHRFCVKRGYWYESMSSNIATYWDFDGSNGKINWEFKDVEAGMEYYQKHWHAWFKFLGLAQLVTGDDKYFDSWKEVYSDWLKNYPCPDNPEKYTDSYGYKSWHQLSVATRISSQLDIFQYFITSDHFTGDWMATFLVEFHKAVEYSRANPYFDGTSNIRFAQQTAEAKAAMLFPEFKTAGDWLGRAASQISDQFSVQFYSDGVLAEMAPNYQLGVMDNFRQVYQIAKDNGRLGEFDPEYTDKMRKACLFMANYIWPDYTWECFNDTFQQTKGVLLRNIKAYAALFPEENLLTYLASERKQGTVPTESLITFTVGGYYMLRTGWDGNETMMILKNNYNLENEWHCHMDNGTFAIFRKGRDFMPDPGVYTYGGTTELDALRDELKATANHNTLTKNLQTIADNYSKGKCLLSRTSASEDLVVTQNASYSDLTHRRAVYMLDKKYFVIVDEAFGSAAGVDVNVSFHLCDGTVKTDSNSSARSYGLHTEFSDGNDMLWRTFAETSAGYTTETGKSKCSVKINEYFERPFYRVTVDKKTSSDVARFITVICPSRSASISASFDAAFNQKSSAVTVTIDGKTYRLSYQL